MKNKIGIVGSTSHTSTTFGLNKAYIAYFSKFGNPVILAPSQEVDATLSMVVMPGGPDILPTTYNQMPSMFTQRPCIYRQYFLDHLLPKYIEAGIPVFGICAGFQSLVAHFGGKLTQHYPVPVSAPRSATIEKMIDVKHIEKIGKKTPYIMEINSIHHQCAFVHQIPECFDILGVSKEYKNVEMIRHKDLPIAAVQFHPEEMAKTGPVDEIINELLS